MATKLLIISDSPQCSTGLARITRELTTRIHLHMSDTFTVATLGMGGQYSSRLPWPQYQVKQLGANRELLDLPEVLRDFANGEKCVLLAIMNPGWVPWLAHPDTCEDETLKACLASGQFERWIYAPIDAVGPKGLPAEIRHVLDGFDRRLFYTRWAADLYAPDAEHLPHGIDSNVFYPRDRKIARASFLQRIVRLPSEPLKDDIVLCGTVATNSARKDWPLAFETVAELRKRGLNAALWAHTDSFFKEYDFNNLTESFGLNGAVLATKHHLSSDAMAWAYSACDVILAPGSEGFGYVLAEGLACGCPVIHSNYAGGAEIVPEGLLIEPEAWHLEGLYCHRRPIHSPARWADHVERVIEKPPIGEVVEPLSRLGPKRYWDNLWPKWREWLLEGVK
jgi:glycosyltransferase involved in cell wall biosynthesis